MRRKEIEENKMKLQVLFRFFPKIYIHTFGLPMMDYEPWPSPLRQVFIFNINNVKQSL